MWSALATHPWAYPLLEVVHLAGIALLLGNLVLLELRVFGAGAALARLSLALVAVGFALAGAPCGRVRRCQRGRTGSG
jgi:acyl-CoA reductase-like NAD-dependent aldehyde dehydrogenase